MARKRRAASAEKTEHTCGGTCFSTCTAVRPSTCKRAKTTAPCRAPSPLALPEPETDVVRFLSSPPTTPVASVWHGQLESPPARSRVLMERDGVHVCGPEDHVCAVVNGTAGNAREDGRASGAVMGEAPAIVVEHVWCPMAERGL